MASAEEKLRKFVRRSTLPGAGFTRLTLVQMGTGGGSNTLLTKDLNPADTAYDADKIDEITAEFLSIAQEDADGHRGPPTSYRVKAHKGISQFEVSPIFRLRSQDSDDESDVLGDTEPANATGLLAQLMRHLEVDRRAAVQEREIYARQSTDVIRSLMERLNHYEERHWDNIVKAEELADERDKRELAKLTAINKEKRLDEALKTVKPLVPVLVSKLKGVPSEAKAALNLEALKSVMANLDPDKMEQIANILGPQSLALLEIWLEANKEQHEQEAPH